MEVDCQGCAGCCLDWRPLAKEASDHERRGPRRPLDDTYNLVPLTRDDVRTLLEAGLADAMTPRLWADEEGIELAGRSIAAIEGKPAFFVGLRQAPKPVAPFGTKPRWLRTCAFLDPKTLQCRIHGTDEYPEECADYPGHNLELGAETECERVEAAYGGERLLDATPPESSSAPRFGPQAVGWTVFLHPEPDRLAGVIHRLGEGDLTHEDRVEFVSTAAASAPGTTAVNEDAYERARNRALAADSWVGRALKEWWSLENEADPDPQLAKQVEEDRGAPSTVGW